MANSRIKVGIDFEANTQQAKQAINELRNSLNQIAGSTSQNLGILDPTKYQNAIKSAKELGYHLSQAINADTGKLDLAKFNNSLAASKTTLSQLTSGLAGTGQLGSTAFVNLAKSISQADIPAVRLNNKLQEMGVTLKNTIRWQLSASLIQGFTGAVQKAVYYAKDLNASLNDIRIVTGYGSDKMADFAKQANEAAKALSTTTNDYVKSSLIFYQQGLSDSEVKARTDVVTKMANVTGDTAQTVSDQMTAVWNNFYDGSKSLEYYSDVMAALGAATASSTDEISEGLNKFAAVADTVGLSYEYAASALATVTATTRESADIVGNSFKTLFARIEGLQLGKEQDDGTTLNKYSKALAQVGIDIKNTNGEMKAMDTILDEMGAKWQTLAKDEQVALAQTVGGVRQYTNLIALLDNWSYFQENLGVARGSEGTLQEQADIYAESWEAAKKRVKAASESIYQSLLNDKFFIDFNNGFANLLDNVSEFIKNLGGIKPIIISAGSLFLGIISNKIGPALEQLRANIQSLTPGGVNRIMGKTQLELNTALEEAQKNSGIQLNETEKISIQNSQIMLTLKTQQARIASQQTESEKAKLNYELAFIEALQNEVEHLTQAKQQLAEQAQLIKDSIDTSRLSERNERRGTGRLIYEYQQSEAYGDRLNTLENNRSQIENLNNQTLQLQKQNRRIDTAPLQNYISKLQNLKTEYDRVVAARDNFYKIQNTTSKTEKTKLVTEAKDFLKTQGINLANGTHYNTIQKTLENQVNSFWSTKTNFQDIQSYQQELNATTTKLNTLTQTQQNNTAQIAQNNQAVQNLTASVQTESTNLQLLDRIDEQIGIGLDEATISLVNAQEQFVRFGDQAKGVEQVNIAMQQYSQSVQNIKNLALNGDIDSTSTAFAQLHGSLPDVIQNLGQVRTSAQGVTAALQSQDPTRIANALDRYEQSLRNAGLTSEQITRILNEVSGRGNEVTKTFQQMADNAEQLKAQTEALKKSIEGLDFKHSFRPTEFITSLASASGQIYTLINSFETLGKTWKKNSDTSFLDKLKQSLLSLSMIIPAGISGLNSLTRVINSFNKTSVTGGQLLGTSVLNLPWRKQYINNQILSGTLAEISKNQELSNIIKPGTIKNWTQLQNATQGLTAAQRDYVISAQLSSQATMKAASSASLWTFVITAVIVATAAAVKAWKDAHESASELAEAAKKSKEEFEQFSATINGNISSFDTVKEKLDNCTKGTKEWKEAIDELINANRELSDSIPITHIREYEEVTGKSAQSMQNGILSFTKDFLNWEQETNKARENILSLNKDIAQANLKFNDFLGNDSEAKVYNLDNLKNKNSEDYNKVIEKFEDNFGTIIPNFTFDSYEGNFDSYQAPYENFYKYARENGLGQKTATDNYAINPTEIFSKILETIDFSSELTENDFLKPFEDLLNSIDDPEGKQTVETYLHNFYENIINNLKDFDLASERAKNLALTSLVTEENSQYLDYLANNTKFDSEDEANAVNLAKTNLLGLSKEEAAKEYIRLNGLNAHYSNGKIINDETGTKTKFTNGLFEETKNLIVSEAKNSYYTETYQNAIDELTNRIKSSGVNKDLVEAVYSGSLEGLSPERIEEIAKNGFGKYRDILGTEAYQMFKSLFDLNSEKIDEVFDINSFQNKIEEENKILSKLNIGDTIKAEDFNSLSDYQQKFFEDTGDGMYMLIATAKELKETIASTRKEELISNIEAIQGFADGISKEEASNLTKDRLTELLGISEDDLFKEFRNTDSYYNIDENGIATSVNGQNSEEFLNFLQDKIITYLPEELNISPEELRAYREEYAGLTQTIDELDKALSKGIIEQDQYDKHLVSTALKEAEALDIDQEALLEHSKSLQKQLGLTEAAATKLALSQAKMGKSVKDVNDNLEDYRKTLKTADKLSSEYAGTISKLKEDFALLLDIEKDSVSDSFAEDEENLKLLEEAAKGSSEALIQLRKNISQDFIAKLDIDDASIQAKLSDISNQLAQYALDHNLTIGATLDDRQMIDALNNIAQQANLTGEQLAQLADDAGYNVEIRYKDADVPVIDYGPPISMHYEHVRYPYVVASSMTYKGSSYSGGYTPSSGGGGGGGSSQTKETKSSSDEIDRYHEINETIDDQTRELEKLSDASERAYGGDKLRAMDKEIAKNKQLFSSQKELHRQETEYLQQDRDALAAFGAEFDAQGRIANYTTLMEQELNRYNDAVRQFNEDQNEDAFEAAEERYENVKKFIEQYEETLNQFEETEQAIAEKEREIADKEFEKLQYKIEVHMELDDRELDYLEHLLKELEASGKKFKQASELDILIKQFDVTTKKINEAKEGLDGLAKTVGKTQEELFSMTPEELSGLFTEEQIEQVQNWVDAILEGDESLWDISNTIHEKVTEAFSEQNEEIDKMINLFDHLNNVIESFNNIIDLAGKKKLGITNDVLQLLDETAVNNAKNTVDSRRANYERMEAERARAEREYEDALARGETEAAARWKNTLDEMVEETQNAYEELLSATEAALEAAHNLFTNNLDRAIEEFTKATTGFDSMEAFQESFDRQKKIDEFYLEDYEKIYDLTKLNRDLTKSIDDSNNIKGKQELLKLQERINKAMQPGVQLTQQEYDLMRAEYDLLVAQIALEEAQAAKQTVRLTRDNGGNWSYTYVNDQQKTNNLQQSAEDKLYAYQKLSRDTTKNLESDIASLQAEWMDKVRGLEEYYEVGSEEYNEAMLQLNADYQTILQQRLSLLGVSLQESQKIMDVYWPQLHKDTGYAISDTRAWADTFKETILGQQTGFEELQTYWDTFLNALGSPDAPGTFIGTVCSNSELLVQKINEIMETSGSPVQGFIDDLKEKLGDEGDKSENTINGLSNLMAEAISNACGKMVDSFNGIADNISSWEQKYLPFLQSVTDSNNKTAESYQTLFEKMTQYQNKADSWTPTSSMPTVSSVDTNVGSVGGSGGSGGGGSGSGGFDLYTRTTSYKAIGVGVQGALMKQVEAYSLQNAKDIMKQEMNSRFGTFTAVDAKEGTLSKERTAHGGSIEKGMPVTAMSLDQLKKAWSFDTGGYTGSWGPEGRLALLHQKEIVLNATDSKNFLEAIDLLHDITRVIDLNAQSASFGAGVSIAASLPGFAQTLEQNVSIAASFPNVTDHNEIEAALNNLVNQASQFANRKNK